MSPRLKPILACLLILPIALACRAACADTLVLAAADSRPTAFLTDGKPTGILVDLVTEAYRRAGHSVDIKLMPWARCLEEAKTGGVDGIFSSFKLPEREEFLAFPKEALTTQVISFFARQDSTLTFDGNLSPLKDTMIGVITGTSYGATFDTAVKNKTLQNIDPTNTVESNLKKLAAGRVALIPSYNYVALDMAKNLNLLSQIKELSPPLQSMPSYLAFTKVRDLKKMSEAFDTALISMKQDGTYDRIVAKYTH
ncbi:transporter substrate-binding domain-containing protein [Telmatospirillum sp.]|uniref:substrate-binding periplasmic protein n=1 Tax=Telmatospirillum sp. TaxID=2079197 RepID=UPI00283C1471|nr:transporter substrate-binding domain-containing protein [Telmatospirillum sp.]MDR3440503.1 transporter substrate-binding domain-containing protein [Telmatospirillum sp.]